MITKGLGLEKYYHWSDSHFTDPLFVYACFFKSAKAKTSFEIGAENPDYLPTNMINKSSQTFKRMVRGEEGVGGGADPTLDPKKIKKPEPNKRQVYPKDILDTR